MKRYWPAIGVKDLISKTYKLKKFKYPTLCRSINEPTNWTALKIRNAIASKHLKVFFKCFCSPKKFTLRFYLNLVRMATTKKTIDWGWRDDSVV